MRGYPIPKEIYVAGQAVMYLGQTIRGPLPILAKISQNGWSQDCAIVAHRATVGERSHWWHECRFRRLKDAKEAFAKIAAMPCALSLREYSARCRGGR